MNKPLPDKTALVVLLLAFVACVSAVWLSLPKETLAPGFETPLPQSPAHENSQLLGVPNMNIVYGDGKFFVESGDGTDTYCDSKTPQHLVYVEKKGAVWSTTTVATLPPAGILYYAVASSPNNSAVFLGTGKCATEGSGIGLYSYNLKTGAATLVAPFHLANPQALSPDGTRYLEAIIYGNTFKDGGERLIAIDLNSGKVSALTSAPKGLSFGYLCKLGGCEKSDIRWVDNNIISYTLYSNYPSTTTETKRITTPN